jgi:predicted ATP-dependent endonuclease of OLD family
MASRMAFFARTVLLVEGPTDEIIINALASRLELSIAGAGCQIVPVTGKGEIPEAAKLFKLAGKRIVVVADLDALADDNSLVNAFSAMEGAHVAANRRSQSSLADMDRPLRTELNQMIVKNGTKID